MWAEGYIILATRSASSSLKHNQAGGERNGIGRGRKCLQLHGTAAISGKLVKCMWHCQYVNSSNSEKEISLLLTITEMERTAPGTGVI